MSRSQVLGHNQHESSLRSLLVVYHFSLSGRNLLSGVRLWPGCEGVLDAAQRWCQGGEMSQQNGRHTIVDDPVEAGLGVDHRGVIRREEAVAIQAARRHEDKD